MRATAILLVALSSVGSIAATDNGIVWPGRDMWPAVGDSMFLAADGLSLSVERDDLQQAPADHLTCEKGASTCRYLFGRCEEVWVHRINQKKGYILIDVAHLRSMKAVGGDWWRLLAPTRQACEQEIARRGSPSPAVRPWAARTFSPVDGWDVLPRSGE